MSQITPNESAVKKETATPNTAAVKETESTVNKVESYKGSKVEKPMISLGEQFKQARQKLNLSIEEIAAKINLKPSILKSIENSEFKNPAIPPAFMRGYVQSYARFLRLPEDIVSIIEPTSYGETKKSDLTKNTRSKKPIHRESSHNWVGCLTSLILLSAIAMTGLWWWENYQKSNLERDNLVENYVPAEKDNTASNEVAVPALTSESKPAETATENKAKTEAASTSSSSIPVQQPVAAQVATTPPTPSTNTAEAPLVLKNLDAPAPAENTPAASASTTTATPATEPANAANGSPLTSKDALQSEMNKITESNVTGQEGSTTPAADGNNQTPVAGATSADNTANTTATPETQVQDPAAAGSALRIEVTGPSCWISVKDGKRKLLAQQEYKQGEVLTFNAGDAYSLIIGAPGNVKITYLGNDVPLKVDGRVAKFKLPRQ